jgi:hypothetical protein
VALENLTNMHPYTSDVTAFLRGQDKENDGDIGMKAKYVRHATQADRESYNNRELHPALQRVDDAPADDMDSTAPAALAPEAQAVLWAAMEADDTEPAYTASGLEAGEDGVEGIEQGVASTSSHSCAKRKKQGCLRREIHYHMAVAKQGLLRWLRVGNTNVRT